MLYGDFLKYWIEIYKKPYIKKCSLKSILRTIRNNIPNNIKNKPLKKLNAPLIDKALADIKLSRSRKYAYYVYYNSLYRAFCLDFIKNNIANKILKIKHKTKIGKALTMLSFNLGYGYRRWHRFRLQFQHRDLPKHRCRKYPRRIQWKRQRLQHPD